VSGRIQEVACWAHVRRKFYDLQQLHASPITTEALERISALYAIESEIRGRSSTERRQGRQARAKPCLSRSTGSTRPCRNCRASRILLRFAMR
jgi:hypothetical protein